jgi:fused signal recognition particle receptor
VAIARELSLPVRFVGVGEQMRDLLEFSPADFVDALLG